MALVSILMPCYNASPWLEDALNSALAQQCEKEVIVVDDGSTDESLRIARSFEHKGVRVISQANRGASTARNVAFGASRGEWIQYLDADDLLESGKVEAQLRMAGSPSDVVWVSRWARFRGSPSDAVMAPTQLAIDSTPVEWLIRKFDSHDMMHPAAWLVPRPVALRAGPWDERLSLDDDGEYFTRIVLAASAIRYCPDSLTLYRSNLANSVSNRKTEAACRSALLSLELCSKHLLAQDETPRARSACANMFMRLAQSIYPDHPEIVDACTGHARRLGGSSEIPLGGRAFTFLCHALGWRAAKRIRGAIRRLPVRADGKTR